jgi:hypothetical protein
MASHVRDARVGALKYNGFIYAAEVFLIHSSIGAKCTAPVALFLSIDRHTGVNPSAAALDAEYTDWVVNPPCVENDHDRTYVKTNWLFMGYVSMEHDTQLS